MQHVRPDEDPLAHLEPVAGLRRATRSRFETGDHAAGHSFSPSAIRDACQQSSVVTISAIRPRIRSASPRWLPSNRAGRCTLRIRNAEVTPTSTSTQNTSTRSANQPWSAEPRERPSSPSTAPIERHHDRREEDDEAPEDERVDEAGDEALEELPLAEDDRRLVAHAARTSPPRLTACPCRTRR